MTVVRIVDQRALIVAIDGWLKAYRAETDPATDDKWTMTSPAQVAKRLDVPLDLPSYDAVLRWIGSLEKECPISAPPHVLPSQEAKKSAAKKRRKAAS